jgi:hypothetical protein
MNQRDAMKMALEALDLLAKSEHPATNFTTKSGGRIYPHKVAVDAGVPLRTALAEPERKPLTDEEILRISLETPVDLYAFARAIERAHGIGGEA